MAGSKLPLAPDDVRGRQMGSYEVLCRLSTGGMAEILLATRRGLAGFHKPVVLKKILPDIQGQEEFVQMFLDEARVTAAFNHPNIAQVFDLDVAKDELFLAMEFVPGATLIEVARACRAANEPMPMGFGLAAARDTALALHYAHTFTDALGQPSPVIHRDVAEKNIMVTYEGVTKLLDFGIAKSLAGASRTQVGMVKGTSGYMSPEQILGEPLDARSDVFSLGVVLHECLTGMRLFPGKAPAVVVNAVLRGPIPEPSRVNKAIPPELDAIVLKALARKRVDRYATALEFARELERTVGPLIWLPEQSGELIRRLFAERREQTRQLLASGRATTGEVKLAQLFSDKDAPATTPPPAPTPPPPPGVAAPRTAPPVAPSPRLPTISAPNFQVPGPAPLSDQTDIVSYSVVTRPPAALSGESRPVPPPPAMAMPPPPPEDTSVQRPVQATARARTRSTSELPTTPASPALESPRAPVRPPPPPPPEPTRTAPPEPAPPRARSLGRSEALPSVSSPAREPEVPEKTAIIRPPRTTPTGEQPVTSDSTVPRYNPSRPARRPSLSHLDAVTTPARALELPSAPPAPAAPPPPGPIEEEGPTIPLMRSPLARPRQVEPEDDGPEFPTVPFLKHPSAPGNEPAEEEELTSPNRPRPVVRPAIPREPEEELTASGNPPPEPARTRRGGMWAVLFLLLVLGGASVLVVLRLDGGLLSSRLFPPPPEAPAAREDSSAKASPAPAPPAGSASAQTPPAQIPPAQTPPAQIPPAGAASAGAPPAEAQQAQTQAQQAQAQPAVAPPAEAQQAQTQAQQAQAPEAVPVPPQAAPPKDEAPAAQASASDSSQPAKRGKVTAGPRRKRGASAPTEVEASPEQVTDANEADRAWQALERERAGTAEAPGENGSLTLATDQYAKVYLGSRLLGETPLFRVSLPSGKHTLRLVGPDGKPLKLLVEIKSGEITSIRVPLAKLARE
ncbi:serine/threonine-protein kinase [Vitiosangium sp. GDMCC 1.1324]|uniref:serine/threonine-protein kinase n=1 Tax=Vitiosangium sp. (strain GDMCC 1.1324) TaxID=2138576 RepID=UPI000D389D9B|nr:serine/threonine-protein kinase [Vitiosangium sp. GDMCC 1.1324]PTL77056.1 serine/threonine protein kinase [Vitiosangium sp. GDMCC 1.1324]